MATTATAFSDMAPSPRVKLDVDPTSFVAGTCAVTVWQISKWGQVPVRNCEQRQLSGGFVEYDYELPPGVPVTYRVEQFNAVGQSLGLVLSLPAQVDIPVGWAVFQDPLAPRNALLLQAELLFANTLKRTRPTAIYQAGDRTLALSGARSAFQDVVLRCVSVAAADREKFSQILGEALVLVRSMPQMRLPGSFYAVVPDEVMEPFDARVGGDVDVWDISGGQVSRPTVDVIVAIYTYDRFKAFLDALHPPTPGTYDDAEAIWSTYLAAMRNPPPEV